MTCTVSQNGISTPSRICASFPGRHPEAAPAIELEDRERDVAEQRAEQQQRAGQAAPQREEDLAPALHRLERGDAERMVEQMARGEGHQHEAGGQAQPGGEIGARAHRAAFNAGRAARQAGGASAGAGSLVDSGIGPPIQCVRTFTPRLAIRCRKLDRLSPAQHPRLRRVPGRCSHRPDDPAPGRAEGGATVVSTVSAR